MRRFLYFLSAPLRLVQWLGKAVFGSVRWTPPGWLLSVLRRPVWTFVAILLLAGVSYGTTQWYRSREANRPRARALVTIRKAEPTPRPVSVPAWDDLLSRLTPSPLVIAFNTDVAPLDEFGKVVKDAPAIVDPAVNGEWKWSGARELTFEPRKALGAGMTYKVTFRPSAFAAQVELTKTSVDFTTPALTAREGSVEFVTDPADPERHQAVTSIEFNQPVDVAELKQRLVVDTVGGTALFKEGAVAEVLPAPKSHSKFFLRSPFVKIPEQEDFVRFRVPAELRAMCGGSPLASEACAKVTVPTRRTGFFIKGAHATLVPDEDGEPQQFLFVETNRPAKLAELEAKVEAWELPDAKEDQEPWNRETVTPAVMARAKRVTLQRVSTADSAPLGASVAFRLKPRAPGTLWVKVPEGVAAPGGFVTGKEFAEPVLVPAFPKEVAVMGDGGALALHGERKLSIKSRGFDHLRFTLGRVPAGQINHLVSQTGGDFQSPYFRSGSFGLSNLARMHTVVTPIARKNDHEANYSAFDLAPELARGLEGDKDPARGLFFIETEGVRARTADDGDAAPEDPDPKWIALDSEGNDRPWSEDNESEDHRFLLVTDLGVVMKKAADGKREVFVLSFQKQVPVAGVKLTVLARNGEPLADATTDAEGHAHLPALDGFKREKQPVAMVARKGSDLAFLPWARNDREVETSRFEVDGLATSETGKIDAFLFTERGIYRPGDSIHVGVIARRRDWKTGLAGVPIKATLVNALQQVAATAQASLTENGFVEFTLPTADTAPTGVWRIQVQRAGEAEEEQDNLGETLVRVEEFQPDRLKLAAKLSQESSAGWLTPKDLSAELEVKTLFELPAADRRVTATMRVAPAEPRFPQWEGWTFHLPESEEVNGQERDLGERRTDAEGRARFPLGLEAHTAPLLRAAITINAFEADGGRGVQGGVNALVSPRERLIGWKSEADLTFLPRNVDRSVRVVAIAPDLRSVAFDGLKRVLIETRHVSVLAKQENGSLTYLSQPKDEEVERVDGSLAAGENILPLPVAKAGKFRYEWRDADDAMVCGLSFTVVGPAEVNRSLQRDAELEISLPKRDWKVGDELEVSLRAPYAGAGLITIERSGVVAWKWFEATTASSIQRITVPAGIEGGAYVHVAFVRRLDSPEIFTNPLSVGIAPFRVSTERRSLSVELDSPKVVLPGSQVTIGIRSARPGRAVVWAVDDGIHRVTKYRAPKPLEHFFQRPALEVRTWQLLDLLLPEFSMVKKSRAYGGDGDEPPELQAGLNPFKRKRNAPVVYWSGIVDCGPERKEFTYPVPDYFAGRLNIMAVALTPELIGVAETSSIVKGPFVLTPNAPLFATPGDEFVASLTIANQTDRPQLSATATLSENLEMIEAPAAEIVIAPNTEATIRFRVRAMPTLGNAEIRFTVKGGADRVSQASTLSIRPASPAVSRIESGWFRESTHEIPAGRALYPQFARREAAISGTPLGYAGALRAYLFQFPHGCTEQTTSKAFPFLLTREEAKDAPARGEAEKAIAQACSVLASRQRSNGGFGYWTSGHGQDGMDELTVYVAHFLVEARAQGSPIPENLHDGAMQRLKQMAALPIQTRAEANTQAAAIYLLTRGGEASGNYALNLVDTLQRKYGEQWHADVSAAWLAGTWMLLKKENEGRELMQKHRVAAAQVPAKRKAEDFYAAPLSRAAQSFTVVCRHFPEIAGEVNYEELRAITEPIQRGDFHTHSAAWSVLALKGLAGFVKASGVKLSVAGQAGGAWKELHGGRFGADVSRLQFRRETQNGGGDAGAWFQAIEFGFPKDLPTVPETRGLEVIGEWLDAKGAPITEAKVGDTLRARIRIRNVNDQPHSNIALVHLMPAGFENAPDSLNPGLDAIDGASYVDVREDRNLIFLDLGVGRSREFTWEVRPTCAGSFVVPPVFAEAMYDRAINGTGVAGQITILPR